MAIEPKRGCGYRKAGGIYLVDSGTLVACHRLPFILPDCCPTCGAGIKFHRGFQWVDGPRLLQFCTESEGDYPCHKIHCLICLPSTSMGLMWVGKRYYSADSFVQEANQLGVSKRIAAIPKGLVPGTPVLLVHPEGATVISSEAPEGKKVPAIIYVFQVTRVEQLIRQSEATPENLQRLEKRGITPVPVPDGDPDHCPQAKRKGGELEKLQALKKSWLGSLFETQPTVIVPTSGT